MGPLPCNHLPQKYQHRSTVPHCPWALWPLFVHQCSESFLQNLAKTFTLVPSESWKPAAIYLKSQKLLFHSGSLLVIDCCTIIPKLAVNATFIISHRFERSECRNSLAGWIWLSVSYDGAVKVSFAALNRTEDLLLRWLTHMAVGSSQSGLFPHNMTAGFSQNEWSKSEYP